MLTDARSAPEAGGGSKRPMIDLMSASVRVGDVVLLEPLTLTLRAGPPTLLVGPNGSGKTTLLKLSMGLTAPSSGTVEVAHGLRKSMVFQRPVMLRRTVAENVLFARSAAQLSWDSGIVQRLLALVGLEAMGERAARRLSGGEQQRLALARALAREPDILFLDEPTASLDPASTKLAEDIVSQIARSGVKIVMATHDLAQARRLAGDVMLLVRGRLVEKAAGPQFFAAPVAPTTRKFLEGELIL